MRIAVNTRFWQPGTMEGYGNFAAEVFGRLAAMQPAHTFYFLFDRPWPADMEFAANVHPVLVAPRARHFISFKWWFDVKVPLVLKRLHIDVFVSPDGFCSLTTRVPQVLVVHDLAFLHYPNMLPRHHLLFYRRYTPRFIKKARVVATVSNFSAADIAERYPSAEGKIINVGSAARPEFMPVEWEEREAVKERFAGGSEYFLFVGGVHPRKNLMNLLKAFSQFKRRQQTNMKLVVAGRLAWQYKEVTEKLATYKYRADVVMAGYVTNTQLVQLVAGAYAVVYPSLWEGFGVPILEAQQSGVPVITSNCASMPEVAGEHALLANPADPADIAEQMKRVFKDENLRSRLVAGGLQNAARFSWNNTATKMWQAIEKATST